MPLPTFVIVGAMKSGTTSLHQYLGQHPEVFVTTPKEVHYFSRYYDRGQQWYESLFAGSEGLAARGESSTSYAKFPWWPASAARLAAAIPDVSIIYLMRNPVDRILSQYIHQVRKGREVRPLSEALASDPEYLNISRYAMQLERFDDCFPRERILLVSHEDLQDQTRRTVNEVLSFLKLPESDQIETDRTWHVTSRIVAEKSIELPTDPGVRRIATKMPPARRSIRHPRFRSAKPGPVSVRFEMTPDLRARIASQLAADNAALRRRWAAAPVWADFS